MPPVHQLAQYLLGPAGLTAQATGFDRRDLLQAICQALPPGVPVDREHLEHLADQVLASRDVVRLVSSREDGPRWSTTELLGVEQASLRDAAELGGAPARTVPPELVEAATPRPPGPCPANTRPWSGPWPAADGLAVVVGPAGAGKTAALSAAAQIWPRRAGSSPAPRSAP